MTIPKFAALLQKGWSLDHMYVLENIEDIPPLINFPRGAAVLQTLFRKGMIDEHDKITEQGKALLEWMVNDDVSDIRVVDKPKAKEGLDGLHKKLEDRLIAHTGKKQMRVDVLGTRYSFLCGEEDLKARIKKVMSKYKLTDLQAIENTLIKYIDNCHKRNRWSPLLMYYIIKTKEGVEMSSMVTDMRNKEEQAPSATKDFEL